MSKRATIIMQCHVKAARIAGSRYRALVDVQARHLAGLRDISENESLGYHGYAHSARVRLGQIFEEACVVALATSPKVVACAAQLPLPFRKPHNKDWHEAINVWRLDCACVLEDGSALALEFALDVGNCDSKAKRELTRRRERAIRYLRYVWEPASNCVEYRFHTVSLSAVSEATARRLSAMSVEQLFKGLRSPGLDIIYAAVRGYESKLFPLTASVTKSNAPRLD